MHFFKEAFYYAKLKAPTKVERLAERIATQQFSIYQSMGDFVLSMP